MITILFYILAFLVLYVVVGMVALFIPLFFVRDDMHRSYLPIFGVNVNNSKSLEELIEPLKEDSLLCLSFWPVMLFVMSGLILKELFIRFSRKTVLPGYVKPEDND